MTRKELESRIHHLYMDIERLDKMAWEENNDETRNSILDQTDLLFQELRVTTQQLNNLENL